MIALLRGLLGKFWDVLRYNEKKGLAFKTVRSSIHKYCETTMTEIDVMPRLARYDVGEKNSSF